MKTLTAALTLALLAPLAGCATTYGTKIESQNVAKIVKGKTTRDDVIALFGQPTQSVMMPDGGRTLYFTYIHQTGAGFYGQVASTMVGKGKAHTPASLSVRLDQNGIVQDYDYNPGTN